jgi:cytochrome c peroxidase
VETVDPLARVSKVSGLICAFVLVASTGTLVFGTAAPDRRELQDRYRRPHEIPFPKGDSYSEAKSKLGRILFFDPILSGSKMRSCASCHNPGLSWSDGLPRAIGEGQQSLLLRTPTLLNVAWTPMLGWDGHSRDLEDFALGPITTANNMNLSEEILIKRLGTISGYVDAFDAAFGEGDITMNKIEAALATFERSIISTEAPFDRWISGDETAIDESAKHGFGLFNGKANCAACHSGWAFTDASFHDIGTAQNDDIGRGKLFPTSVKLRYAFKTPTLRDVARRGPYMHDGSVPTLKAVIELYDRGGVDRPSRANEIYPLGLTEQEKADLIAFLDALTGKPALVSFPTLPR